LRYAHTYYGDPDGPANLSILITGADSGVTLGANQDLAYLSLATSEPGTQSFDLSSPSDPTAFRAVRVRTSSINFLNALIKNARENPGDGIFDSGLSNHPSSALGIGLFNDPEGNPYVFIRPTRIGDLNLDGLVTISDFIDLASNFNSEGTWQQGDMNYDGRITISDFIDLASNFGGTYSGEALPISPQDQQSLSAFAASIGASVPEPATFLLPLAFGFLARRRRAR
jgi:hypothetical protein